MNADRLLHAVESGESVPEPDDLETFLAPGDVADPASGLRTELHDAAHITGMDDDMEVESPGGATDRPNLTVTPRIASDSHGYAPNDTES